MIDGTIPRGIDKPRYPGTYAVEVFCGWKLLDWSEEKGWHMPGVCRWATDIPVQWVGPLPARKYEGQKRAKNPPQEFDL